VKLRAAVLEEFGRPLVVQEVDLADPSRPIAQAFGGPAGEDADRLQSASHRLSKSWMSQRADALRVRVRLGGPSL